MSGFKVERLYAFICVDPNDGDEGVMGFMKEDGEWMPMIGADTARVESLELVAEDIKKATGLEYKIKYFKLEERE